MIYEFTRATIKHNFPRAVLMTWWERYFIKAIAPGMDTETQAVGTKRTRYRPLTSGSSVRRMPDDRDARGHVKCVGEDRIWRGCDSYRTWLICFWSYQINMRMNSRAAWKKPRGQTFWDCMTDNEKHNGSLTNEEGTFQFSFIILSIHPPGVNTFKRVVKCSIKLSRNNSN